MKIKSIKLNNYRNYSNLTLEFSPNVNVIVGKNAQGKTNLLEAIFFSAIGKSLRTHKESDLILWGKETAKIETKIEKKYGQTKIGIYLSSKTKKSIKINDISVRKIGELLGELRCVYFSPDELKLIKESPEDRRRFMDISISQTSKPYFYLLSKYDKLLASKNKVLKNYKDKIRIIKTPKTYKIINDEQNLKLFEEVKNMLDIYNLQLADVASKIVVFRQDFIINLAPYAKKTHEFLTSNEETLTCEYQTDFVLLDIEKAERQKEYNKLFLELYGKNTEKDLFLGYTSVGPHKDDLDVKLNGIDVRYFGSQGQQRTAALSLKLAEIEIIRQQTGETPILILDDVLSELDLSRRNKLLKFCSVCQTFLSSTDLDDSLKGAKIITINKGEVV
ncbi:MAG: DNA replication/repair protein RecF [Clostridia bacterium]|nr:DNA replication/repair protein RecF [Clostridia bacterium]